MSTLEIVSLLALSLIALSFAAIMTAAYFAYRYSFAVTKKYKNRDPYRGIKEGDPTADFRRRLIDGMVAETFTDAYIKSRDGLTLRGRIKIVKKGAPFAIMCHGYRSTPISDFAGGAPIAMRLGFNVLLIDQRAHGGSEGRNLTFGAKECLDVADWARYIESEYGADVILFGISMGAATVLMSAGIPDLPGCVKGVFADCPYSSARDIMIKVIKSRGMPLPQTMYRLSRLGARMYGGFDPNDASPIESIRHARVPIVLVHGENDHFVPHSMSEELSRAGGITLHSFKDATHGTAYIYEPERYAVIVEDFCRACLSGNDNTEKETEK